LRQLAELLARAGFHTLRFDFSGCGDSNGDFEENSVPQWLGDISLAVEELKRRTNLEKVSLMGCRLGATLALMAAAAREDIEALMLWNPIWNGGEYCKELRVWHRNLLRRSHVIAGNNGTPEIGAELLGFAFPFTTIADLERLDVSDLPLKYASRVLVMENKEDREAWNQEKGLRSGGTVVDRRLAPTAMNWNCYRPAGGEGQSTSAGIPAPQRGLSRSGGSESRLRQIGAEARVDGFRGAEIRLFRSWG
jgi:pimeloyl-ACP methyl ester carboxylesterase